MTTYLAHFVDIDPSSLGVIARVQEVLAGVHQFKCTACHYCTDGCPMGIPIPDFFKAMNRKLIFENEADALKRYRSAAKKAGVNASDCIQCGQCEDACPQRLPIIEYLQEVADALE